jgi:hypothetical protein
VLRPGGLKLTRVLLDNLAIGANDEVVEFAPGLGVTARMILQCRPQRYIGIERDAKAAQWTAGQLPSNPEVMVAVGRARSNLTPCCFRIRGHRRGNVEHANCRAQAPDRGRGVPVALPRWSNAG